MQDIALFNLAVGFAPAIAVIVVLYAWSLDGTFAIYAMARMVLQLLTVGYVLVFIFDANRFWIVLLVLAFMLVVASWIALQPIKAAKQRRWPLAMAAIAVGGFPPLLLVTQFVLSLSPPWQSRVVILLAGMIFSIGMNCVSLAGERYQSEMDSGETYREARNTALRAALIPITNSLLSVGLVSLPGMMTGQILDGISPLIAVRYQIMVMSMIFGSGGMAAVCYLTWIRPSSNQSSDDGQATLGDKLVPDSESKASEAD